MYKLINLSNTHNIIVLRALLKNQTAYDKVSKINNYEYISKLYVGMIKYSHAQTNNHILSRIFEQ